MQKLAMPYAYRVVAEVDRRGTPKTFYIRDQVEIGIPSVATKDVKVALRAEGWFGEEHFKVERLEWGGRLYAEIPTRDLHNFNLGNKSLTRDIFCRWFGGPAESLLRYPYDRDTSEMDGIPLGVRVVRENMRDETADRIKAIAAEGLLFVDGIHYRALDMPCGALHGPYSRSTALRGRSQAARLTVDIRDGSNFHLRCRTAFLFAIDELEKAKEFLAIRGMGEPVGSIKATKEKTEFGIRISEADPYWLQRSNIAVPNAISAVNVHLRAIERHVPELGSKGMASLARLAALRSDLEVGRVGAVFDLTTELGALATEGFHMPKDAFQLRRTLADLYDVSVGSILGARDLPVIGAGLDAEANDPKADDGLSGLEI